MAEIDVLDKFKEKCSDAIEEYFEKLFSETNKILICEIPASIIAIIVSLINTTKRSALDWREYVSAMGIDDYLTFACIEANAEAQKELPLYIALTCRLKHRKFGQLIQVLLNKKRLDVLTKIKPYFQDYLEGRMKLKKEYFSSISLTSLDSNSSFPNGSYEEKQNYRPHINAKCEDEIQQNTPLSIGDKQVNLVQNYMHKEKKYLLSAFIPHTAEDYETAQKFQAVLRTEFHIDARLLSDLEAFIAMDDCGVLNAILNQVHFILPVVSPAYLKYIYPSEISQVESEDVTNNRYIFRWIQSEFKNNSSVNFRVRPVMVEKLDIRFVTRELIFSHPFRLWNDIPKLVQIMVESKHVQKYFIKK